MSGSPKDGELSLRRALMSLRHGRANRKLYLRMGTKD